MVDLEAEIYNGEPLPKGVRIGTPKSFYYDLNHVADPNIVDLSRFGMGKYYVARRTINASEEITAEYLPAEFE